MSSESYGHCATGPGVGGPRSLVAAVTAVLTAIAVMGVTAWQGGFGTTGANPGRHAPGGRVLRRYTDPAGWSLRYPRDWHLEQSEQELHLAEIEVTVANFAPRSGIRVHTYPGGGNVRVVPPVARSGRFPSDGVALRLENPSGYPSSPSPDTRLPVGLRSLRASKTIAGLAYDAATGETFGRSSRRTKVSYSKPHA